MYLHCLWRHGYLGNIAGRHWPDSGLSAFRRAKAEHSGFLFLVVINAVVAVWAAPAVSASDFTQNAHSFRAQALGQTLGLIVAYILFAVASVCIIAGASIHYGMDTERAGYCAALGQLVCFILCGAGDSDDDNFNQRHR